MIDTTLYPWSFRFRKDASSQKTLLIIFIACLTLVILMILEELLFAENTHHAAWSGMAFLLASGVLLHHLASTFQSHAPVPPSPSIHLWRHLGRNALISLAATAAYLAVLWVDLAGAGSSLRVQAEVGLLYILPQVVFEEIAFRVVIPLALGATVFFHKVPGYFSVLFAAVFFAAWHLPEDPTQFVDHFAFGLLMSLLFSATRSLVLPILFHLANNIAASTVTIVGPVGVNNDSIILVALKYLVWVALLAFFVPGFTRTAASLIQQSRSWVQVGKSDGRSDTTSRIQKFDRLRFVALFLVVAENILLYLPRPSLPSGNTNFDLVVQSIFALIIEYRGLPLFSILLGFSFYAARRNLSDGRSDSLRSWALIAIGAVHGIFVFSGDILTMYGVLLLVLSGVVLKSSRRLRFWVVCSVFAYGSVAIATSIFSSFSGPIYQNSILAASWEEALSSRAGEYFAAVLAIPFSGLQVGLPLLLGYATADRALSRPPRPKRGNASTIGLLLLTAGIVLSVPRSMQLLDPSMIPTPLITMAPIFDFLALVGGTSGAFGAWLLVMDSPSPGRTTGNIVAARMRKVMVAGGQSTLTGYVGSSALMVIALPSYGLGLAHLGFGLLLVASLVYCLLVGWIAQWGQLPLERWVRTFASPPAFVPNIAWLGEVPSGKAKEASYA